METELELYDILLDGLIEVLHLHGIKHVEIPNTLTLSIATKCIDKLQNTSHNNKDESALKMLEEFKKSDGSNLFENWLRWKMRFHSED